MWNITISAVGEISGKKRMSRACNTREREEKWIQGFGEKI
jgi:hypothetical protein